MNEYETPITDKRPNLIARLIFSQYSRVLWIGFRRIIELKDLNDLHNDLSGNDCYTAFQKQWNPDENDENNEHCSKNRKANSLFGCIIRAFWKDFLLTFCLSLIFNIFKVLPIFALRGVIQFVSDENMSVQSQLNGYFYCILMLLINVITCAAANQTFQTNSYIGLRVRSALMTAIYRKCLTASTGTRRKFPVGDLVNMMSVDVDNIYNCIRYQGTLISGILRILFSYIFVGYFLGVGCAFGLPVILICIAIAAAIGRLSIRFQVRQMIKKDKRLGVLGELLSSMKLIKLYAWEVPMIARIEEFRRSEIKSVRLFVLCQSLVTLVWYCCPVLVITMTLGAFVMVGEGNALTPERAFIGIMLLNGMRYCLIQFPICITMTLKFVDSLNRIKQYLLYNEKNQPQSNDVVEGVDVCFENASFSWVENMPLLSSLDLTIKRGEIIAVVGKVGAGKSSLLSAILGEMNLLQGSLNVRKVPVAYVPQEAWILNESLKQNIVFTSQFDSQWYNTVTKKCCLIPDFDILPAGDGTEIGERGVNLSGGQKQRVSLARAVYQRAKIFLLDDPLSAVDAHVASSLFEDVIGPRGLLRNETRILVTHSLAVLPHVDRIVTVVNGKITHIGTYEELMKTDTDLKNFTSKRSSKIEEEPREMKQSVSGQTAYHPNEKAILVETEKMEVGKVNWVVYGNLLKHFGVISALLCLTGFICFRVADVWGSLWLSDWTNDGPNIIASHNMTLNDFIEFPPSEITLEIRDRAWYFIKIYLQFGAIGALSVMIGVIFLALGCLSSASHLHKKMLWSVARSPMSFFDSTPIGRVLNRFGKDIDVLDTELCVFANATFEALSQLISIVILILITLPLAVIIFIPACLMLIFLQRLNVASSRQFRRLLSTHRSPVLNSLSETIEGVSSIQAFAVQDIFLKRYLRRLNIQQNCFLHSLDISRWTTVRADFCCSLMQLGIWSFVIYNRDYLNPGLIALLLTYSFAFGDTMFMCLISSADTENTIVAAERVEEYTRLKSEDLWTKTGSCNNFTPERGEWPNHGEIVFVDYSTRYRPGMSLVLKNINLRIVAGEKVGVIGRTGSGKSSLTLALFRIIEAAAGQITIDGINIAELGLHELRKKLTIIPQDPSLFQGTLRSNLDPHEVCTDEEVWIALEKAHLKNYRLESFVEDGGKNLSVGERQMICLARALLRKSKIIILDEATASVDVETDYLIQETIRRDFANCTIITIAHRINTVLDCDSIVVLDEGKIVEKGMPGDLLKNTGSLFFALAKSAGLI